MNAQFKLIGLAALAVLLPALDARAWIITQTEPAAGKGLADAVVMPFDIDPGLDMFEIHKYFQRDEYPLVLKFQRQPGDQNTIRIVDELILNMMTAQARDWNDFHVVVYTGVDGVSSTVSFTNTAALHAWQMSGGDDRLGGAPVSVTATRIDWFTTNSAQYVPYGPFTDAPDNQLVLRGLDIDVSQLAEGSVFYLKEWPTTPEPAAMTLLALGAGAVLLKRRRGRES